MAPHILDEVLAAGRQVDALQEVAMGPSGLEFPHSFRSKWPGLDGTDAFEQRSGRRARFQILVEWLRSWMSKD